MLANEFVKLPMMFWLTSQEPDAPRWGLSAKHAMRDTSSFAVGKCGQPTINFFGHGDPLRMIHSYWHEIVVGRQVKIRTTSRISLILEGQMLGE